MKVFFFGFNKANTLIIQYTELENTTNPRSLVLGIFRNSRLNSVQFIKTMLTEIRNEHPDIFCILKDQLDRTDEIQKLFNKTLLPSFIENNSIRKNIDWSNFASVLAGINASKKILIKQKRPSAIKIQPSMTFYQTGLSTLEGGVVC